VTASRDPDKSAQDRHYLEVEGDAFFARNFADADPSILRPGKRRIAEAIEAAGVVPKRVLEFGCNYGDLLEHYAREHSAEAIGVEASGAAVAFGRKAYGDCIRLEHGTLADNAISADEAARASFDLVVVDDVLCWVSRETLLQSIANIDAAISDGGFLFLREFLPLANQRNRNHHVDPSQADVYCYKPAAPHYKIFTATGTYEVIWQQVWMDRQDGWLKREGRDAFESRWSDVVLRKSYSDYFSGDGAE
jgi:SAM-dependent methyltransferase